MKRRSTFWTAAVLTLLLAGCGEGAAPATQQPQPAPAVIPPTPTSPAQPAAEPELTKQMIAVYYTDQNIADLKKEEQEIAYKDEIEKYKEAIALLEKPKQAGHDPLWQNFRYHSVTFQDGQLTIDADSSNQYNLGGGGEALAIEALRQTLFQFPEVQKIVILEDGQPIDSLMGHVDISEPLTR
ncbi:GerMN domain-containing protein [Brevibacillus sp. H7]|uniref:GerMN domain-containing protein n=1 Tax=Brevibacillus sp. H7 TaxID=3349138 RepID=UPI003822725C